MSRADAFRRLAWDNGATQCIGALQSLPGLSEICDDVFAAPAVILALSRRSDVFCFTGLGPLDLSAEILAELSETMPNFDRIIAGVEIGNALAMSWVRILVEFLETVTQPRMAMAKLLVDRARSASLYHTDFKLEGRSLGQWFTQVQTDPFPLVDALARSHLVRPGAPDRSVLTNSLIAPQGAMFRIFSPDDIAVINSWISSLGMPETQSPSSDFPKVFSFNVRNIQSGDPEIGDYPSSIRDAYTVLQGRALPPKTREFAQDYCYFWLQEAASSLDKSSRSLPRNFQPKVVRRWLMKAHDDQSKDYLERPSTEMPTREDVIEETLQLAPLTLIDGAWLQGFTDVPLASSQFGSSLFETYWDELGNGQYELNHPKIFRYVLRKMDIELPSTGSASFASDPRLLARSFRLPVYWLCLGKLPRTFCPEILGMNLAMELSGVGGAYRHARTYLKHHGFPTLFVDLHNTIDNVSTGYAAWAVDAINAYMLSTSGTVSVETTWNRIRVGYESLSPLVDDAARLDFFKDNSAFSPPENGTHISSHPTLRQEAFA